MEVADPLGVEMIDGAAWAMLEFAPDGILVVAESGLIEFANQHAIEMFRCHDKGLAGRSVDELLPAAQRDAHRLHRARYREQPEVRAMGVGLLLSARRCDDTEFHAEISLNPLSSPAGSFVVAAVRDISDRVAAEQAIREHQEALLEAERIVMLVDDRERIARDLHDTVIQRLFAAGLGLQSVLRVADDVVRPRIERTIDELDTTIRELRSAIFSLGASTPTMGGLRGRVLDAINAIGENAGIETRVQFDGPIETLDSAIADELVPVTREAMSNAAKHGAARNIRVSVTVSDGVVVTVTDDGSGIHGEVVGGRGLANLRERAARLGGTVDLTSAASGGCELRWSVPLCVKDAEGAPTGT